MSPEQVLEVIDTYRGLFRQLGIAPIEVDHNSHVFFAKSISLGHCHGMLDKMVAFVHQGKMEEVFRWLGFIQGVLWVYGDYSLEELKTQNRSSQ